MRRTIIGISLLLYGIVVLVSCSSNDLRNDAQCGYLSVGVSDEFKDMVQVKADDAEEFVYRLDIYDSRDALTASIDDHRTVTPDNPVKLLMDKYRVTATYGQRGTAFNAPAYGGENTVRVYPEKDAFVDILCKMSKIKFSVHFPEDEAFASAFRYYEVKVSNGTDALTFSSAPDPADATQGTFADTAYFEVPANKALTYTLKMINADGALNSVTREITGVNVAQHYHFDFKLGEREDVDGALVLNVLLDGEYREEISHNILLNFDRLQMPSYGHNPEFDPDLEGIVYPLGNEITKKFTFEAPRGIASLVVSHLDANLLSEGLPQVTDFVNISAENSQIMSALGIIATPVTESSVMAEIDVTEFVKNLPISPDNQPYRMSLTVIDTHNRYASCDFEFTIVSDIQAETGSARPWSSFSILNGRFFSRVAPAGVSFQYKEKSASEWIEIESSEMKVDLNTLTYSYRLNHLTPGTTYVFRSTSDKDKADGKTAAEVEFTTFPTEGTVYNLGFDDWVKVGKAWYATNDKDNNLVWDSANEGTADILGQSLVPTTPEENIVIEGKAARMESGELLGNFAAGNIYTGDFGSATISPVGAKLYWGIPFSSRPLALRGWYRYEPVAINRTSSAYSHLSGQTDFCQIQIFLTSWASRFEISTGDNRFVDTSDSNPEIIAHGQIISQDNTTDNEGNVNGYVQFTIPLKYRNMNEPTFIVISGAASRYGDYFTGGLGSTMYLDELELIYDPDQLTDEEFELVMNGIN